MNALLRWALLPLLFLTGCVYTVQIRGYGYKKPSNVALYVQIDTRRPLNPQPVGNLDASKFKIYEDGKAVTPQESRQIILNQQAGAVHYTMLLLDLSGSMAKSEQLKSLERAASTFANKISEIQRVGVYVFDGSPTIKVIVPFTSSANELRDGIPNILNYRPTDLSTNLYGAVVEGLNTLKEYRDRPDNPKLSFATLVVFTDGSDLANRITKAELKAELEKSATNDDKYIRIYSVGLGNNIDRRSLRLIGRDDHFTSGREEDLMKKFTKVADRIDESSHRYYLFSYCSPARAGNHKLKIKVVNGELRQGRVVYKFDATGFTPKCNPNDLPDLQKPADVEAKEREQAAKEKEAKEREALSAKAEKERQREAKKKAKEDKKAAKKAAKEAAKEPKKSK